MEFAIGDEVQLEMKVGDNLLFGGTYKCTNKFPVFTKEDLKPGMVVEFKNGEYAMILPTSKGLVAIEENDTYTELSSLSNDLKESGVYGDEYSIVKIYGLSKYCFNAHKIEIDHRELLWERKEHRQMTISEIKRIAEEKIGEQIEVIERLRNDRITIGGVVFKDIKEAQAVLNKVSEWEDIYKRLAGRK